MKIQAASHIFNKTNLMNVCLIAFGVMPYVQTDGVIWIGACSASNTLKVT
jgi:hypothetical protein